MKYSTRTWIFDCPLHGFEMQVFCFRAHDKSLEENWKLYEITYEEQQVTDTEKQKFLVEFREAFV